MRFLKTLVFAGVVSASPFLRAAVTAPTPEALRDAVKAAFEARSAEDWKANVETGPLSPADIIILDKTLGQVFAMKPTVESIELGDLGDDFDPVLVGGGRKYTLTLKPIGVINLKFRTGPHSVNELALPYGKVPDGFKLGTLHGETLAWKGPEDREFHIRVKHTGAPEDILIRVKYNASGVDLEKRVSGRTPDIVVPAQFVDSVEVERTGDTPGETTLDISCQGVGDANAMKSVYASEKLTKAGTITFKRKAAASAPTPTPVAK